MLSEELLKILCCPKCQSELIYNSDNNTLSCNSCGRIFEIQNDIPILMIEEDNQDD